MANRILSASWDMKSNKWLAASPLTLARKLYWLNMKKKLSQLKFRSAGFDRFPGNLMVVGIVQLQKIDVDGWLLVVRFIVTAWPASSRTLSWWRLGSGWAYVSP